MVRGFIALLNTELDLEGHTIPIIPSGWTIRLEDSSWYSIIRTNNVDRFFHVRLMIDGNDAGVPGKAVFLVCGDRDLLKTLYDWCASNSIDVWTLSELRADGTTKATRIKSAWREHDEFSNPILSATMAGRDYPQASEETISENDLEERILDAKDGDQDLTVRQR